MARIPGAPGNQGGPFRRLFVGLVYALTRRRLGRVIMPVQGDDVVVVRACVLWIRRNFEPQFMHEFDVLRAHARRMRAEGVFADCVIRRADFQGQTRARLRQTLPCVASQLRLLIGCKLVGESADNTTGIEPLCSYHDGFEDVSSRHN